MPREVLFKGRKIEVALDTTTLPDGQVVKRDVIVHPGAVVIVPMIDRDHVCLLRNERFVVNKVLLELPAGTLEPRKLARGRRRARAGGRDRLPGRPVAQAGRVLPLAGRAQRARCDMYVAEDLTPGPMQLEPGETLQPEVVSFRDALTWAVNGTIRDAKTVIGLLLWERLRDAT